MASAGLTKYNEALAGKIQELVVNFVQPSQIVYCFHKYDARVLTRRDMENVKARVLQNGNIDGASLLLERLVNYENWFHCLLSVLNDPEVKLAHIARILKKVKAQLDREWQEEPSFPEGDCQIVSWDAASGSTFSTDKECLQLLSQSLLSSLLASLPDEIKNRVLTDADASRFVPCFLNKNWKSVLLHLGIPLMTIENEIRQSTSRSSQDAATILLIKWRQKEHKKATVGALLNVFDEVDKTDVCDIEWQRVGDVVGKIKSQMNIS